MVTSALERKKMSTTKQDVRLSTRITITKSINSLCSIDKEGVLHIELGDGCQLSTTQKCLNKAFKNPDQFLNEIFESYGFKNISELAGIMVHLGDVSVEISNYSSHFDVDEELEDLFALAEKWENK